jgi:hypothetical protein
MFHSNRRGNSTNRQGDPREPRAGLFPAPALGPRQVSDDAGALTLRQIIDKDMDRFAPGGSHSVMWER